MAFQIKDFVSIATSMVNHARATQTQITDFNVGSVARTMLEAPAIEIDELYQRMLAGILEAIPVAVYKGFNFERIDEASARGNIVITFGIPIEVPFVIPAGSVFENPSTKIKYVSVADVAVAAGAESVSVLVICAVAGVIGNASAGTVTRPVGLNLPSGSIVSNDPFTSGRAAETDEERMARFADFVSSLSRGTIGSIRFAARQAQIRSASGQLLEYVSRVGEVEEAGLARVYVYGSNGLPSSDLIAEAQKLIDGWRDEDGAYHAGYRPIGVYVHVLPMIEVSVPVQLSVSLFPSYQQSQAIKDAIKTVVSGVIESVASGDVLYVDKIVEAALAVTGVREVLIGNNENISCMPYQVLKLGDLSVEWL